MSESLNADIAVVGGGLSGLTLAGALAVDGHAVALVESSALEETIAPGFDARTTAIAFSTARIYQKLGLWDEQALAAEPIRQIIVRDGRMERGRAKLSRSFVHFEADDLGPDQPLGWIVENRRLRAALIEHVRAQSNIAVHAPADVVDFEGRGPGLAKLTLADGAVITAPLVAAADGRESRLREIAGVNMVRMTYPQTAIVAMIKHARPHKGLALELFYPAGPFAFLPMADNHASIVWTESTQSAQAFLAMPEDDFVEALQSRLDLWFGDIELVGGRHAYPLTIQIARRFSAPRLALVSEAAHRIHPIAGQGLNVGLRDVAALAELTANARRHGLDIGAPELLKDYDRWRRFDAVALGAATHGLNALFSNDIAPMRWARRAGLGVVQRIGPAKRLFMREAGGGLGDLPALLRG